MGKQEVNIKFRKLQGARREYKGLLFLLPSLAAVLLGMLTIICCYPIAFIITGSLMGNEELKRNVVAVFSGGSGYAGWSLLPYTLTLRSYIEILLDSPGFFVMFWNSVKVAAGILAGQMLVAIPAAWGLAEFRFPGHRAMFLLYIILMMMPFQVLMLSGLSIAVLILPVSMGIYLLWQLRKFYCGSVISIEKKNARIWAAIQWSLVSAVVLVLLILIIRMILDVPIDMIPNRWSNFEFWSKWWDGVQESGKRLVNMEKSIPDQGYVATFMRGLRYQLIAVFFAAGVIKLKP